MGSLGYQLLTNVSLSSIKPLQKTNHQKAIYPTFFDLWVTDCYYPTIYAYRLGDNSEERYALFVNQIKKSLEKILVPFFPFAGRWIPSPKFGRQLDCNDEGVPFVEAYVDKCLDSVVQVSGRFQPVPELNAIEILGLDSSQRQQEMLPGGLPSLLVQVTRFKCGAVVLGVTWNHMTADACSFFDFMVSWSEMARNDTITIKPNFDRSLATTFEAASEQMGGKNTSDPFLKSLVHELKSPGTVHPASKWRLYEVNAASVEALKLEAKKSSDGTYISINDCIVAHFWKWLSSLSRTLETEKAVAVGNAVEGRKRFYDKPITNVTANVLAVLFCPMSASEALSRPIHVIAQNIRRHLLETDWKQYFSLDSLKAITKAQFSEDTLSSVCSSWASFPLYKIEFGLGGTPFFATINPSFDSGYLLGTIIYPPIPGHPYSAATLVVNAPAEVLDVLEGVPGFWSFVSTYGHR